MKHLLLLCCMLFVSVTMAQIDSKEETALPFNSGEDTKPVDTASTSISLLPTKEEEETSGKLNGLTLPKSTTIKPEKKEFSMLGGDEEFANPGELYEDKLKQHLKMREEKERKDVGSTTNQYLGDFKSKAAYVNIVYRDHEYPDGDMIRILVNDDIMVPQVTLHQSYSGIKLNLTKGFNKIDFLALNQGTSGPNTAEFQVVDDNGMVISSNRWNLTTGVKATIIIVKE